MADRTIILIADMAGYLPVRKADAWAFELIAVNGLRRRYQRLMVWAPGLLTSERLRQGRIALLIADWRLLLTCT